MYSYKTRVRYTETDASGRMNIGALIDAFQTCSNFQSDDLGIGLKYLIEHNSGWIIAYHEIEFYKRPFSGDYVEVGTWAYKMRGCMGYRNFIMKDEAGEVLAVSDSLWVFMDLEHMRMAKIPSEVGDAYMSQSEPQYEMETHKRKISLPEGVELAYQRELQLRKSDVDSNGHINNTVYVHLALEFIPEGKEVSRLRVEYRNQAFYGQTLRAFTAQDGDYFYVALKNEDDEVATMIEFTL